MKKFINKIKNLDKKWKIAIPIALVIIICAIVGAVIFVKSADKDDVKVKDKIKEFEVKEEKKVQVVDLDSKSRPYAIMINNINVARTVQSGLSDAYLVYEIIVEGGITRYLALYKDANTDRIGSIRSARHYYLDYVLENDAIYVHHGQSDQAAGDFGPLGIDRIVADNSSTGWRDTSLNIASEHTLFTKTELLDKYVQKKNMRATTDKGMLLKYSAEPVDLSKNGEVLDAKKVNIKYSNYITSSYEYDEEAKVYKRFVNGDAHVDKANDKQLEFKNIIVYKVGNYDLNDGSGKGRQGLNNVGSGEGIFISEGKQIKINWKKESRSAKTVYTYDNGEEITVNDGKTFIQIVPTNGNIVVE